MPHPAVSTRRGGKVVDVMAMLVILLVLVHRPVVVDTCAATAGAGQRGPVFRLGQPNVPTGLSPFVYGSSPPSEQSLRFISPQPIGDENSAIFELTTKTPSTQDHKPQSLKIIKLGTGVGCHPIEEEIQKRPDDGTGPVRLTNPWEQSRNDVKYGIRRRMGNNIRHDQPTGIRTDFDDETRNRETRGALDRRGDSVCPPGWVPDSDQDPSSIPLASTTTESSTRRQRLKTTTESESDSDAFVTETQETSRTTRRRHRTSTVADLDEDESTTERTGATRITQTRPVLFNPNQIVPPVKIPPSSGLINLQGGRGVLIAPPVPVNTFSGRGGGLPPFGPPPRPPAFGAPPRPPGFTPQSRFGFGNGPRPAPTGRVALPFGKVPRPGESRRFVSGSSDGGASYSGGDDTYSGGQTGYNS